MVMEEFGDAFKKGESLAVKVEDIEKELAKLWQEIAAKDQALTRVCKLNLLVYSPNEGAYERAALALAELTRRHHCRAIAVIAEPEAKENDIAAYLSAHFHKDEGKMIGCEKITIIAKGSAVDQLAEKAMPLLIGDLPTVLWWQGDLPEENVLFEKLLAVSRHLIFDSADGRDVGNSLSRARAINLNWKNLFCGDLNWRRLLLWRDLITEFMDSPQAAPWREHVAEVALDVVEVAEGDAHFAKPFLLLGWFANFLNWKLNEPLTPVTADKTLAGSESVFRTSWQKKDKEALGMITLHKPEAEVEETTAPGRLLSAQIRFQQKEDTLLFSVQSNFSQARAAVRVTKTGQTLAESTTSFAEIATPDLLAQEIDRTSRDPDYENALRFATQLI